MQALLQPEVKVGLLSQMGDRFSECSMLGWKKQQLESVGWAVGNRNTA